MADYLLDTNHASPLVTLHHPLRKRVFDAMQAGHKFNVCVPVLSEVWYGISVLPRAVQNRADHTTQTGKLAEMRFVMSKAIKLNGALADELRREAQAQNTTVEELLGYLLQLAQCEGRRREALTQIEQISEQIAREFKPEKIILFGSYAYGIPRQGSDIDLLVIMPYEGSHVDQSVKIHRALNYVPSLDLLVRTPEEVQQRIEMNDFFMREITEKGKVLYDARDDGVDRNSRRGLGVRAARRAEAETPNQQRGMLPRAAVRGKVPQGASSRGKRRVSKDS